MRICGPTSELRIPLWPHQHNVAKIFSFRGHEDNYWLSVTRTITYSSCFACLIWHVTRFPNPVSGKWQEAVSRLTTSRLKRRVTVAVRRSIRMVASVSLMKGNPVHPSLPCDSLWSGRPLSDGGTRGSDGQLHFTTQWPCLEDLGKKTSFLDFWVTFWRTAIKLAIKFKNIDG